MVCRVEFHMCQQRNYDEYNPEFDSLKIENRRNADKGL